MSLVMHPQGDCVMQIPSSLFCFPAARRWPAFFYHILPAHDVLPYHGPKSNGVSWAWTQTCETMNPNKPVLLQSWLAQVFCYSDGELSSTNIQDTWYAVWTWEGIQICGLDLTRHTKHEARLHKISRLRGRVIMGCWIMGTKTQMEGINCGVSKHPKYGDYSSQ